MLVLHELQETKISAGPFRLDPAAPQIFKGVSDAFASHQVMGTLIYIFLILVFDTSTLAIDTTPGTSPDWSSDETERKPWYFKGSMECRPLEIHLQKILLTDKDCGEACDSALVDLDNLIGRNPETCYRGGNLCEYFYSQLLPPVVRSSPERQDVYSHQDWADPASTVYQTDHGAGSSSSTANIGCMPLFNTDKQKRKKKNAKKVASMQESPSPRDMCKCDKFFYYQSVLVGNSGMVSCSASEIRSRHELDGWQVFGNKDEDPGEQGSCNNLDYDEDCPSNLSKRMVGPESGLNRLAQSPFGSDKMEQLAREEMEQRDSGEGSAVGFKRPYRDKFEEVISGIWGQPIFPGRDPDPGEVSNSFYWSDQQSGSDPDC
jgi:hypothetical protein